MTPKQIKLIQAVVNGNPDMTGEDDKHIDLDQLLDLLREQYGWDTTKQSIQFSIRGLIKKHMIKKVGTQNRRGRRRVLLAPTYLGYQVVAPSFPETFPSPEGGLEDAPEG